MVQVINRIVVALTRWLKITQGGTFLKDIVGIEAFLGDSGISAELIGSSQS